MSIDVKDTQEIIRHAVVQSHQSSSVPVALDPKEVGMATGPRIRKRSQLRSGALSDYLHPGEQHTDEWQKLDDDTYKFLQLRKQQFARMEAPPSHQFIAEMESQFKYNDPNYEFGGFLGLMRQAADLDETRQTFVTASERSAVHAFARRLTHGRRLGEVFDPIMVKRYRDLMDSNQPTTLRGVADLFRLISRAARQPLIGAMRDAPAQTIGVLLHVIDLAVRFNQKAQSSLEFQLVPMDVFLGARTVLFNRSVANPTMSMVKELVLDEGGLYHHDLVELMKNVSVFGTELTLSVPESMTEDGFALKGSTYSAVELVMAAGAKLVKAPGPIASALSTLADAIVHKIQQQDGHKDRQVQGILTHFNQLLLGERRSANRVTQERQQVRFDYMTAIQRAGRIASEMQTGQFPIMVPSETEAIANPGLSKAEQPPMPEDQPAPAAVLAGLSPSQYEALLGIWDTVLGRVRKQLTTKSLVFKSLATQLARVRALDTCLVYGLTPAGARCTSRLAKLISGDELRNLLNLPEEVAAAIEDTFSRDYPAFLSSLETLITTLYEFNVAIQTVQFRKRDRSLRNPAEYVDAEESEREAAELDELLLKLILGSILLAHHQEVKSQQSLAIPFDFDGNLLFTDADSLKHLGRCDPFLAYCAFLFAASTVLPRESLADLDTHLKVMSQQPKLWQETMSIKYQELKQAGGASAVLHKTKDIPLRKGWEKGCELGFMDELADLVGQVPAGKGLDLRLREALNAIQVDIDIACEAVEEQKSRLTRDKVSAILD